MYSGVTWCAVYSVQGVVMYSNGIVKSKTLCKVFKLLCKEE